MTVKLMTQPWLWKRFYTNAIMSYAGGLHEPILDFRGVKPALRICDGVKLGGHLVGDPDVIGVATPQLRFPVNGAGDISLSPILTGSTFSGITSDYTSDTHQASRWQVSLVNDFSTLVYDSAWTTTDLESHDLSAIGQRLIGSTVYYARVAHRGVSGKTSNWSTPSLFTTTNITPDEEDAILVASDAAQGDQFGYVVDISASGTVMVIGAPWDNDGRGGAYVYKLENGTWVQKQKLTPATSFEGDNFGIAVAMNVSGSTIAIGAHGKVNDNQSVVHIYNESSGVWIEGQNLVNTVANNYYGHYLALSANAARLVVGAYGEQSGAGCVYIYGLVNGDYVETEKMLAPPGGINFGRGLRLSADGSTILSVARYANLEHHAWVVKETNGTWGAITSIKVATASSGDFSMRPSITEDGNVIAFGLPSDGVSAPDTGKVFLYEYANAQWSQTQVLTPSNGASLDEFGWAVSLASDASMLAVGAPRTDRGGNNMAGSVYLFHKTGGTYTETTEVEASDQAASNRFGYALSLSAGGSAMAATAFQFNNYQGKVYVLS